MNISRKYAQNRGSAGDQQTRVVVILPEDDVMEIDDWGVENGMPSRTATIRHLLEIGLKSARTNGENHPS